MPDNLYLELIIALAVILGTIFAICFIRLALKRAAARCAKRPHIDITVYYSEELECFELMLERLVRDCAGSGFEVSVTVVDTQDSPESRAWLSALRDKLGGSFGIRRQGGENDVGEEYIRSIRHS